MPRQRTDLQGLPDSTHLGRRCCEQGKAQGLVAAGSQRGHGAAEERQDIEAERGSGREGGKEGQVGGGRGDAELREQSAATAATATATATAAAAAAAAAALVARGDGDGERQ